MNERSIVGGAVLVIAGTTTGGALAGAIAHAAGTSPLVPAAVGIVAGAVAMVALVGKRLTAQLPGELDGWFARRRVLAVLWMICALLAVR